MDKERKVEIELLMNKVAGYALDWIYQEVDLHKDNLKTEKDYKLHFLLHNLYLKNFDNSKIINQQQETIESLKCCGNCETENLWYGDSECPHRSECNKCFLVADRSFWQPIK